MRRSYKLIVSTVIVLVGVGCQQKEQHIKIQGEAQGTTYNIQYIDKQGRNLQTSIDSLLSDFDQTASLWEPTSIISRINDGEDCEINQYFVDLVEKSNEIKLLTDGKFDCTIGQLIKAWGFWGEEPREMTQKEIDSLMTYCNGMIWTELYEDGTWKLHKENPRTKLDFNAIAQGYSVDLICQWLEQQDIENYLVDVGGEVRARGRKANGDDWMVGIERPADNKYSSQQIETAVRLRDCAIVTSGNYRKYYEKEGKRYSHTIDPQTGRPVMHTLLSVSVIDDCAWRADALATSLMVMGLEEGKRFIAKHPEDPGLQTVMFIYDSAGSNKIYMTPQFKALNNK